MVGLNGIEIKECLGNYEVLFSNMAVISNGTPFSINVDIIEIRFVFINDGKEASAYTKPNDNTLIIEVKNVPVKGYLNSQTPLKIGKLKGRDLYIVFNISQLDEICSIFYYTLLLSK